MDLKRMAVAESPNVQIRRIGDDGNFVVIADGFYRDPDYVRELALSLNYTPAVAGDSWPGVQAFLSIRPPGLVEFCENIFRTEFGLDPSRCDFRRASIPFASTRWNEEKPTLFRAVFERQTRDLVFSMPTLPEEDVRDASTPHVDTFGAAATLVYLNASPDQRGGTGFFRHRRTGVQSLVRQVSDLPPEVGAELGRIQGLSEDRFLRHGRLGQRLALRAGRTALRRDSFWRREMSSILMHTGLPQRTGYLRGSTDEFEMLELVEAKYNRFVMYPTWQLHAMIYSPDWYGSVPEERRLTQVYFVPWPVVRNEAS
jgi:hypothetical protein